MKKVLLSLSILACSMGAKAQISLPAGATAPDFTVTDAHGKTHNLKEYCAQGKYVMLDFFSTTCGSCIRTVPKLEEFYEKYGCNTGDVVVISIDKFQATDAQVLQFEQRYGSGSGNPTVSGGQGGGNAVASLYGPAACPSICIINPQQVIEVKHIYYPFNPGVIENAVAQNNIPITPQECSATSLDQPVGQISSLFPNPANDQLSVGYQLGENTEVTFEVYDLLGAKVKEVKAGEQSAGAQTEQLDVSDLTAGMYMMKIKAGDKISDAMKFMVR